MSNYTMQKIENLVCSVVNEVLNEGADVLPSDVYDGKKNIPFKRAVARNVIFVTMHNCYGFTYQVIGQRADMDERSVMRCVRKFNDFIEYDAAYRKIASLLSKRLGEIYGE